jgi:hypothetical protein
LIQKQVVAGLGEIGKPILSLISKAELTVGYDVNPKLMDNKKYKRYRNFIFTYLYSIFIKI